MRKQTHCRACLPSPPQVLAERYGDLRRTGWADRFPFIAVFFLPGDCFRNEWVIFRKHPALPIQFQSCRKKFFFLFCCQSWFLPINSFLWEIYITNPISIVQNKSTEKKDSVSVFHPWKIDVFFPKLKIQLEYYNPLFEGTYKNI